MNPLLWPHGKAHGKTEVTVTARAFTEDLPVAELCYCWETSIDTQTMSALVRLTFYWEERLQQ